MDEHMLLQHPLQDISVQQTHTKLARTLNIETITSIFFIECNNYFNFEYLMLTSPSYTWISSYKGAAKDHGKEKEGKEVPI